MYVPQDRDRRRLVANKTKDEEILDRLNTTPAQELRSVKLPLKAFTLRLSLAYSQCAI